MMRGSSAVAKIKTLKNYQTWKKRKTFEYMIPHSPA